MEMPDVSQASIVSERIFRQPKRYNMSILKFSDGEEFDLSGPLRVELRADGFYVLGENMMMAVNTLKEGIEYINSKKSKKSK
jgi:hypothetical protein